MKTTPRDGEDEGESDDDEIGGSPSTRAILGVMDIASLLFPSLGKEKSEEEVLEAAKSLGLVGRAVFSVKEGRSIVHHLASKTGLVGVVSRFAISRGEFHKLVTRVGVGGDASDRPTHRKKDLDSGTSPGSPRGSHSRVDVAALLAPSLGADKARELVSTTAQRLGLNAMELSRDQALMLLESIAMMSGLAGVVARFAKASLTLETK